MKRLCPEVNPLDQYHLYSDHDSHAAKRQCRTIVSDTCPDLTSPMSSTNASTPACGLCDVDDKTYGRAGEGSPYRVSPACVDPRCLMNTCETCSEHDECCECYVAECDAACESCPDCDDPEPVQHDVKPAFEESCSELFGQDVDLFPFNYHIPHSPIETTSFDHNSFNISSPFDLDAPKPPQHALPNSFICSRESPDFRSFQAPPTGNVDAPASTSYANFSKEWNQIPSRDAGNQESAPVRIFQHFPSGDSTVPSASPASTILNPSTPSLCTDAVGYLTRTRKSVNNSPIYGYDVEGNVRNKIKAPAIPCQWADQHGHPCGRIFTLGDDLHEHLKTDHEVKSEIFCRWLGCSVSVFGSTPHRYANTVQRHTWGHSGHRPYKCSTCHEGFAAAKVLDEHFVNFHLQQKAFACDTCSHQCTSAANLKRHKDEKHRAERFQCEFCNQVGKIRVFPRGPNLARHFRKCKSVLASFPEAGGAAGGKIDDDWFPPGYWKGNHGMDRAKVIPPTYMLPSLSGTKI